MSTRTILFAGGGSGGHIFPNIAVHEKVVELLGRDGEGAKVRGHYLLSGRQVDQEIVRKNELDATALPAVPLRVRPGDLWQFYKQYKASEKQVRGMIREMGVRAVVATGGFVSGPAVKAAKKEGVPVALVNLDAVPGKANKFAARDATEIFSVYASGDLPRARPIGLPLRGSAKVHVRQAEARERLGLNGEKQTLLVFAGSQGGRTLNEMMVEFASRKNAQNLIRSREVGAGVAGEVERSVHAELNAYRTHRGGEGWQVMHLTGAEGCDEVAAAYERAGIPARVERFCNEMHLCWSAATVAICRAGAGSVAEAWVNGVPSVFLPYPFHKDNHQHANVEPLVAAGGAMVLQDLVKPIDNASQLVGAIKSLMTNEGKRDAMRKCLAESRPEDGASAVAQWILTV